MPCCGRGSLTGPGSVSIGYASQAPRKVPREARLIRQSHIVFEYVGRTGLTAIGGVSGKRYRFEERGARVAVDPVDKPSLASVPNLRRIVE